MTNGLASNAARRFFYRLRRMSSRFLRYSGFLSDIPRKESELRRRRGGIYPMSLLFTAAGIGIICDRLFCVGRIWPAVIPLWIGGILFFLLRGEKTSFSRMKERLPKRLKKAGFQLKRPIFWLILALTASAFGFEHYLTENRYAPDDIGLLLPAEGSPAIMEVWVDEMPDVYRTPPAQGRIMAAEDRTYFRAEAVRVFNGGKWETASGRIAVSLPGDWSHLQIGDRLRLGGTAYHPAGKRNPGDRNQAVILRRERILLQLSVNDAVSVIVEQPRERYRFRRSIASVRTAVRNMFRRYLSPENEPLASAMILGIRTGLDAEVRSLFQETGAVHLLAISGLHIGLVTGFFYFVLRFIGIPRTYTALGTALAAIAYLLMTDMRAPAIRAAILSLVLCGGILFRRRAFSINSLSLAAILILLWNPSQLFDTGVHLSFLAAGVFFWFPSKRRMILRFSIRRYRIRIDLLAESHPIRAYFLRKLHRFWSGLLITAFASFMIWQVLLPLILNRMNLLSTVGLILQPFLWLPVMISLVSCFLLMLTGSIFPAAASFFAQTANWGFDLLRWILETAQSVRYSHFFLPGPPDWWCAVFYTGLVAATLFPPIRPRRRGAFVLIALWMLTGIAAGQIQTIADSVTGRLRVNILSVGHGDAALIRFPDHRTVLCDCGTFGTPESVSRRISGALFAAGGRTIDLVILSHADADHYNGLFPLMDRVKIKAAAVSPVMFKKQTAGIASLAERLTAADIPVYSVSGGDNFASIGFPELSILHPSTFGEDGESNANSLVTALRYEGRGILFPGDLDSKQAEFLRNSPQRYDLILAPHHGGKSENYQQLLDWSRPDTIVISGGTFQRSRDSEEDLRRRGYHVWNTADSYCVYVEIGRTPPPDSESAPRAPMTVTPTAFGPASQYEIP